MITKQRSLIGLAALFAIASAQACSSDPADPVTVPMAGSGGSHTGSGGSVSTGGTTPLPSGGSAVGGSATSFGGSNATGGSAPSLGGSNATGGSAPGAGGSSAGSGSGGRAGGPATGAGGGSSTATYAAVQAIFKASCGTGTCHNGNPHTNFQMGELYTTLTTAIAATPAMNECNGTTLVTPGDATGSFLVKVISNAMSTCKDGGADNMIPKMPFMCGTNPMCLSADKVKTITDWIAAGAPH